MKDRETPLLLRGGRVLDPESRLDGTADLRIEDGRIAEIARRIESAPGVEVLDLEGLLVTPGLIDLHVHLREPGQEAKETIATGAAAAAAGGFTTVCAMPNTDPVVDTAERVRQVVERGRMARGARVLPIAAATVGSLGRRPTEAGELATAGAVAVSDDGLPIATAEVLAEVLRGAAAVGLVVADHCEDRGLSAGGVILAGRVADELGVRGIDPEAESSAVARDLEVLAEVGGRLHLCHLSTSRSVRLLRAAREKGLPVTAEVSPHHLTLTTDCVAEKGALAKMNPPLATDADREALVDALADGTIGCVATDHAPHTTAEKTRDLAGAPFGIVGLETAFAVLHTELVERGGMELRTMIERLTWGPARAFGLDGGRIAVGDPADAAVFDLRAEWTVDPAWFRSKGRSTPWEGRRLLGRPVLTIVRGKVVFDGR